MESSPNFAYVANKNRRNKSSCNFMIPAIFEYVEVNDICERENRS